MNRRSYIRAALAAAAAATLFFAGVFAAKNDFGLGRNMEIMANLMRELATYYVDEVSPDEMMRNGARGITSKLDPYTEYLPESEMSDFETLTTGKYGGIGAMIRQDGDFVIIAEPYKGSPADRAGLAIGDRIVAIDGEDAKGMTTADVSARLKGEPNTTVRVAVEKLVGGSREEVKIRRERIVIPSISYSGYVADGIGYIRHADFTDTCYDDMRVAILALQERGDLRALILDYRNNGGGVMQSAVKILSLFVPKGTKVLENKGRNASSVEEFRTEYEPLLPDTPLAVLVNGNTASAAEIVSGAIQDLDRGVLIGQRSFGKGLVQSTHPVGYNSYVKMTSAKYYIPSGRCIQAVRYSPDGRAEIVADSLVNEFRTAGGRKVYDGGGIMPDIKTSTEYVSNFAVTLYLTGIIDNFGDEYMRRHHADSIDSRTFSITDADYDDFVRMVEGRDVAYKSDSRRALEHLRASLAKERYDDRMGDALKAIDENLHDDKMSNLQTYRKEIVDAINSNILLRFAYSEGVIENSLADDADVARAVGILQDEPEYRRILTEQDTERK